jgi:exodeoxyribonuclease VII small subunit
MAVLKFEDALGRLENIVQTLERGELSLEESLKAFEEGVKLSKSCLKLLDDAERRVDILVGERGRRKVQPFPTEDDTDDTETTDGGNER